MKIYNDGVLVAISDNVEEFDGEFKVPYLRLIEGTRPDLVPLDLFGFGEFKRDKVSMLDVINKWLPTRIFPENRDDLLEMLERDYGIIGYGYEQKMELLKITKGRMAQDKIMIEFD